MVFLAIGEARSLTDDRQAVMTSTLIMVGSNAEVRGLEEFRED